MKKDTELLKKIQDSDKVKLVMAKDWWETEDLDGKLGKVKVSDGPVGLRCLAVTDSWANDSIYPSVAYPCYQMLSQTWNLSLAHKMEELSQMIVLSIMWMCFLVQEST